MNRNPWLGWRPWRLVAECQSRVESRAPRVPTSGDFRARSLPLGQSLSARAPPVRCLLLLPLFALLVGVSATTIYVWLWVPRGRVELKTLYANGVCHAVRDEQRCSPSGGGGVGVGGSLSVTDHHASVAVVCEGTDGLPWAKCDYPNPLVNNRTV